MHIMVMRVIDGNGEGDNGDNGDDDDSLKTSSFTVSRPLFPEVQSAHWNQGLTSLVLLKLVLFTLGTQVICMMDL